MSEKYGEPLHLIKDDSDAFEVRNSQGKSVISICLVDGMEWTDYEFDTEEVLSRFVSLYNLCAGRTPEQIEEAFRLLDNREKVVDWLNVIEGLNVSGELKGSHDEISDAVTAALALLQVEKEGDA